MKYEKYLKLWLIFVNLTAKKGYEFNNLIDSGDGSNKKFIGAWANIIVKARSINEAIEIIAPGLSELNFEVVFVETIENFMSLVERKEIKRSVVKEGDWLLNSSFVFKISDKIFPYTT